MTQNARIVKAQATSYSVKRNALTVKGAGKPKSISLDMLSEKDIGKLMGGSMKCPKCSGKGKIAVTEACKTCEGKGKFLHMLCLRQRNNQRRTVRDLRKKAPCPLAGAQMRYAPSLKTGKTYEGKVQGHANFRCVR